MYRDFASGEVFRQADGSLLEELFANRGLTGQDKWRCLTSGDHDSFTTAWAALDPRARGEIERDLRHIHTLATSDGIVSFLEEGHVQGLDLNAELDALDSFLNKALHVFNRHRQVFDAIYLQPNLGTLSRRCRTRRCNLPKVEPDCSPEALTELAKTVAELFWRRRLVDSWAAIKHNLWDGRYHHIRVWPRDGLRDSEDEKLLYDVVYLYDPQEGTLELYVKGNKRIRHDLRQLFGRIILHAEIDDEDIQSLPFRLNRLKDRALVFPTDPEDGVLDVRIIKLHLSFVGAARRWFCVGGDPAKSAGDVYDLMDLILDQTNCPKSMLNVRSADFQMTFDNRGRPGPETTVLTFRIKYPDLCTLKDTREELLARKYLKRWGLERG